MISVRVNHLSHGRLLHRLHQTSRKDSLMSTSLGRTSAMTYVYWLPSLDAYRFYGLTAKRASSTQTGLNNSANHEHYQISTRNTSAENLWMHTKHSLMCV